MDSQRLPAHRPLHRPFDPVGYLTRRLSSILVALAVIGGFILMGLVDGLGVPRVAALATGLLPFIAVAWWASTLAGRTTNRRPPGPPSRSRDDLGGTSQLGPDPVQVIARSTGART